MKTITKISTLCLLALMTFTYCKKETAGPKGDTGAAGTNGTSGTNGISNITVTNFTSAVTNWSVIPTPYNYLELTIPVPAITSSVVTSGDARVYFQTQDTSWVALPYSQFTQQYVYKFKTGQVKVDFYLSTGAMPSWPGVQYYKIVIFPPAFIQNHPEINFANYSDLRKKIKIED